MSTVSSIASNSGSTAGLYGSDTAATLPAQTLSQQDFLKLLVTQMTSQDPMNPSSDLNSIAQMAQFSTLQESQTMETDMARLNATALIGQTVSLQDATGGTVTGQVSGMMMDSGTPQIVVNGSPYSLTQILSVTPTPVNQNGSPTPSP